jgi:hypothetical protein
VHELEESMEQKNAPNVREFERARLNPYAA